MKIAFVTTNFPRWIGDFRVPFIYNAAKAIHEKGHTVRIITMHNPGAAEHESFNGLEVIRARYLPEKYEVLQSDAAGLPSAWQKGTKEKLFMFPFFWNFCRAVFQHAEGFDIIHAHWSLSGLAAFLTKSKHKTPYIVTVLGSDVFKTSNNPLLHLPVSIALRNASAVIALSNALSIGAQKFGVLEEKTSVIPIGINIDDFPMSGSELRDKNLLFVGSLIDRKGVHFLLQAMIKVKEKYPDYKLIMVGEGILLRELKEFVDQNRLNDNVHFLGPKSQSEVSQLMQHSKVFILPSTEEGLGLVLVEALASGTPVIGSDIGGISDVITPDVGLLIEPANSNALFSAIEYMIENEEYWRKASKAARLRAEENYSWPQLADKIIDIYRRILDNKENSRA